MLGDTPPVHGGLVDQLHDTVCGRKEIIISPYINISTTESLPISVSPSVETARTLHLSIGKALSSRRAGRGVGLRSGQSLGFRSKMPRAKILLRAIHYQGGTESTEAMAEGGVGLATLRPDGYTDLELDAGRSDGILCTIPIRPAGASRLLLNADCGAGWLEVEMVDPATGRPLPGCARADCIRIEGNSTSLPVAWRGHPSLLSLQAEFQVRIYFHSTVQGPKLYSLRFQ